MDGTVRMDALKPRRKGVVPTMARKKAWIAVGLMVVSAGCKVGNPMDRTVKVTQQPSQDGLHLPSPQTRLASGSLSRDSDSSVEQASLQIPSERSPHEANASERRSAPRTTTVARKTPATPNVAAAKAGPSSLTAFAVSADADTRDQSESLSQAELLEAFRDSPPEVQQQALRQWLAVSGTKATKTESPQGITAALHSTVENLPALPEDAAESTSLPSRLASQEAAASPVSEVISLASGLVPASGALTVSAEKALAPPASPPSGEASAEPIAEATQPSSLMSSAPDEDLYNELVRRLERAVPGESEADRYRRQIISRHLMLFAGNPDSAVTAFDGMKQTEQDFLRHYLLGVWSMIDSHGHPVAARRWSAAIPEMRQATQQLSAASESLDVRSLAFCKEIQSFGQVTAFESKRFEAGQKVILYCEIDNFLAQSTADGFETHLQGSYEFFDSQGRKVAGQVLPADKQLCANHLRDYFIAYQMNLPTNLDAGDYRLELTMECLKGQKYGQASIPLAIVRPTAVR